MKKFIVGIALLAVPLTVKAEEKVEIPEHIIEYCEDAGEVYNICPELLEAIAWTESRCQADAVNGGCIGVMQVSKRWHMDRMERLGVDDLTDAKGNILVSADYIAELAKTYNSPEIVLAVYNGDAKALDEEYVSEYAKTVLELSESLEREHGK